MVVVSLTAWAWQLRQHEGVTKLNINNGVCRAAHGKTIWSAKNPTYSRAQCFCTVHKLIAKGSKVGQHL